MKISVIIPVYNCEKYLHKCVDSIINQTYAGFEIILVDDGATDKSPSICDEYSVHDERIKVIHKQNGGVSSARNAGLKFATGDYITFVDADDWLEIDAFEKMLHMVEPDVKIYFWNLNIYRDGMSKKVSDIIQWKSVEECMLEVVHCPKEQNNLIRACWGKLYRRDCIKGVLFPENLYIGEDACFLLDCLMKVKSTNEIRVYNEVIYNYRYVSTSATKRYKKDLLSQSTQHIEYIKKIFEKGLSLPDGYTTTMSTFAWQTFKDILENGEKADVASSECVAWCDYADEFLRAKGVCVQSFSRFCQLAYILYPWIGAKGIVRLKKGWNQLKGIFFRRKER